MNPRETTFRVDPRAWLPPDIFGPRWTFGQVTSPWLDASPIREEIFGPERLAHHAESLARVQSIAERPRRVLNLTVRLKQNAAVLLAAYRYNGTALLDGQAVPLAAQWLLDNYHLVEQQLTQIASDLPPGYYRQLPKVASGPFAGYPNVSGRLVKAYDSPRTIASSRRNSESSVSLFQKLMKRATTCKLPAS
ncbi:hypothetical protein [Jannaschia seohaensis]|uniref:hypothetical protein n=1 Tax=Jannaschia seohaensis TaxID=475081 RepID=UPI0011B2856A|nr:hypothetical protein [Jannaschia seohaensis]